MKKTAQNKYLVKTERIAPNCDSNKITRLYFVTEMQKRYCNRRKLVEAVNGFQYPSKPLKPCIDIISASEFCTRHSQRSQKSGQNPAMRKIIFLKSWIIRPNAVIAETARLNFVNEINEE